MIFITVSFVGLFIMLAGNLDAGTVLGDLAGVAAAIGFAAYTTIVRSDPQRDWSPVMPGYSLKLIAICWPIILSDGSSAPSS